MSHQSHDLPHVAAGDLDPDGPATGVLCCAGKGGGLDHGAAGPGCVCHAAQTVQQV